MSRLQWVQIILFTLVIQTASFGGDEVIEPEVFGNQQSLIQAKTKMDGLYQMLIAQAVDRGADSAVSLPLSDDEIYELMVAPQTDQVGITRIVNLDVDLAPAVVYAGKKPMDLGFGAAVRRERDLIWTGQVISQDATAMRLHFEDFDLPEGVEVFVFNDDGEAHGPYTGRGVYDQGSFWSDAMFGEVAWVQVRVPAATKEPVTFVISEVAHFGPRFFIGQAKRNHRLGKSCESGGVDSCVENAMCEDNSIIDDATDAIAHYTFQEDGGGWKMCSGGLIADSDASTSYPYFLTAYHCISSESEAQSITAYFDFTTANACHSLTDWCGLNLTWAPTVSGASLMATGGSYENGDYALLKLNSKPSGRNIYLGSNAADYSDNEGVTVYRVSHPNGYPQAWSTSTISTTLSTCSGSYDLSRPKFVWSYRDEGGTMGGSSGAPLLNWQGKVVGNLSGGCVADTDCGTNKRVRDGSFHYAFYRNLRPFLYPTAMHVDDITVVEQSGNGGYQAKVTVRIVDDADVPVSGAHVMVRIDGPMFFFKPLGTTDANGVVTLYTPVSPMSGSWSACTVFVDRPGLTMNWDRNADRETCATN